MAERHDIHRISDAIRGCLSVQLGEFDFTGASGRGRHGVQPPRIPWVEVSAPSIRSEPGMMHDYTRTVVYDVSAWAQVPTTELTARTETCERLADALLDALERERLDTASPLYNVPGFTVSAVSLDSAADPVPTMAAFAMLTIELAFRRRTALSGPEAP